MQTILIVEDDPQLQNALSDTFIREGFNTLRANDGIEGLQKALENSPNLVILDLLMPNMDGMTMLNELRKDASGRNMPVIILTNMQPDKEEIDKVMMNYPSYFLIKTVALSEVVEKVREVLEKGTSEQNKVALANAA
jgi:two-component system alkaline phosphatase synthesis response regulator PhoP